MTKHGITVIATAMAMAVTAAASAAPVRRPSVDGTAPMEEEQPPAAPAMPLPWPDTGEAPAPTGRWTPSSRVGIAVMGGAGVTSYAKSAISDVTSLGGAWGFRFTIATRRWLSFEAAYVGGRNQLSGVLASTASRESITLNRNGVEGALRVNAPLYAGDTLLSPFILAGAGWTAFKVNNIQSVTADAGISNAPDNTFTVPLAVGFAVGYRGFIADVRGTYRPTFLQSTFIDQGGNALTNWDAGGMLGVEF